MTVYFYIIFVMSLKFKVNQLDFEFICHVLSKYGIMSIMIYLVVH